MEPSIVDPHLPRLGLRALAEPALVLGAFQRAASAIRLVEGGPPLVRRHSGGPTIGAGPGTLHLWLSLPRPDALVPCDAPRLLNRYVRPLLRGLSKLGAPAVYGGRDWVSVARRPVAWVGFAHDEASGASLVEAFIAIERPFPPPADAVAYPPRRLDSFAGRAPTTLALALGRRLTPDAVADTLREAFQGAYGAGALGESGLGPEQTLPPANDLRPPFRALEEDVIGFVGARVGEGGGLGGDYFASEGVARGLDEAAAGLAAGATPGEIDRALEGALDREGGALEGLRDPGCLRRALVAAAAPV